MQTNTTDAGVGNRSTDGSFHGNMEICIKCKCFPPFSSSAQIKSNICVAGPMKIKQNFLTLTIQILCTGSNPYNEDATKNVKASVTLNVKYSPKWNGTEESMVLWDLHFGSKLQICTSIRCFVRSLFV